MNGRQSVYKKACSPFLTLPATSLSGITWLSRYLMIFSSMQGGSFRTRLTFRFLLEWRLEVLGGATGQTVSRGSSGPA